jgi:hypothetical protein
MQHASALLALLERVVRSMLRDESRKSLSDGEIRAILAEMLRVELKKKLRLEVAFEKVENRGRVYSLPAA